MYGETMICKQLSGGRSFTKFTTESRIFWRGWWWSRLNCNSNSRDNNNCSWNEQRRQPTNHALSHARHRRRTQRNATTHSSSKTFSVSNCCASNSESSHYWIISFVDFLWITGDCNSDANFICTASSSERRQRRRWLVHLGVGHAASHVHRRRLRIHHSRFIVFTFFQFYGLII